MSVAAVVNVVAWCALFFAIFLTVLSALRYIIIGDLLDIIVMIVSVVCLVLLVAAVTA